MRKATLFFPPALALSLVAMAGAPAIADEHAEGSYSATLGAVNNSGASGEVWIDVNGGEATVMLTASGLAETFMDDPFPHVQHIHIGAAGQCPTLPEDDENEDGIISTGEGAPLYGGIGTTLSVGDADKSPEGLSIWAPHRRAPPSTTRRPSTSMLTPWIRLPMAQRSSSCTASTPRVSPRPQVSRAS